MKIFSFSRKGVGVFNFFLILEETVVADTGFMPDMLGKKELVWCGVALRLSGFVKVVVAQGLRRSVRFVTFKNQSFGVSKRICLVSSSGVDPYFSP